MKKTLVAFFSASGTTKKIAEMTQRQQTLICMKLHQKYCIQKMI